MRDKTTSKTFRAKKRFDHLLEGLLPGVYLPLCTMVTPQAEAARLARHQDRIIYAGVIILTMSILVALILLFRFIAR